MRCGGLAFVSCSGRGDLRGFDAMGLESRAFAVLGLLGARTFCNCRAVEGL